MDKRSLAGCSSWICKEWDTTEHWASLVIQLVKNLPATQETWVQSLGWEDPLEEEMITHSRMLAWTSPWTEEPGGLPSMGSHILGSTPRGTESETEGKAQKSVFRQALGKMLKFAKV